MDNCRGHFITYLILTSITVLRLHCLETEAPEASSLLISSKKDNVANELHLHLFPPQNRITGFSKRQRTGNQRATRHYIPCPRLRYFDSAVASFPYIKRFLNSIKGMSSSSSELSLSCLYFLANLAKGTFSSDSESDTGSESEACGGIA